MNCIWIITDSFRQDHIHCYRPEGTLDDTGDSIHVRTPSLDKLATEAVMFDRMRAEGLPTIPCRRGIFTGRRIFPWRDEPPYKGDTVRAPGWRPLLYDDVTLAEHLSEQGYVTSLVADVYHIMKPSMNFHRGFQGFHWVRGQEYDHWKTQPLPPGYLEQHLHPRITLEARRHQVLTQFLQNHVDISNEQDWPVARTFRWAIEWLERNHSHKNFYLYIDTFSPHEPWFPPQRFLDVYDPGWSGPKLIYANPYRRPQLTDAEHHHVRARYAAMCTMVDEWIGKLLAAVDRLKLRDNTLIVLMSDHGKIIGEFGSYGMPAEHMGYALGAVPCFIRHPKGVNAGRRFRGWLYNIDLTATVLSLLGVAPKPDVEGKNVWPAVSADDTSFRDHLVTGYVQMVSAWQEDWLYLLNTKNNTAALYNLAEDIHRKTNVADRYPGVAKDLAAKLDLVLNDKNPRKNS
jgi:arylsulfatase A-like enzyme